MPILVIELSRGHGYPKDSMFSGYITYLKMNLIFRLINTLLIIILKRLVFSSCVTAAA